MFNLPFGGFSFLLNVFIVIFGKIVIFLRKNKAEKNIVSQTDILKLEKTKFGWYLILSFYFLVPILIFTSVTSMSLLTLYSLYVDEDKVTIFDVAVKGVQKTKNGVIFAKSKLIPSDGYIIPIKQQIAGLSNLVKAPPVTSINTFSPSFLQNEEYVILQKLQKLEAVNFMTILSTNTTNRLTSSTSQIPQYIIPVGQKISEKSNLIKVISATSINTSTSSALSKEEYVIPPESKFLETPNLLNTTPTSSISTTTSSTSQNIDTTATTTDEKKETEERLIIFMNSMNIDSSLKSRKKYAKFFGIKKYTGTQKQNILLIQKLGEMTSSEIRRGQEIETINQIN